MRYLTLIFILLFLNISIANTQNNKKFRVHTIAFYNVENLFDTINDPLKFDESSPIMELKNNRANVYSKKINNISRVISEIGSNISKNSPVIIGLAEIENRIVLEDLANNFYLIKKNYGIVHFDSPDIRGIDVALLYQKLLFTPTHISKYELKIYEENTKNRIYTRDQLLVSGKLENELIHILINHWPSRRGGEERSKPKRIAAAKLNKRIIDSLQSINPYAKIFIMGDLNDNPTNTSVKDILKTKSDKKNVPFKGIYNPMERFSKKGIGSNAFRDSWSLFDQIMITKPLLEKDYSSFRYYRAGIFNANYLINSKGRFKGYPFRSFADGSFTNGYSDHFPVYIYLIKEVKN
ncbi:endonuclease/exonuclease/phosphatase family protein [Flavobacteriaceae bacterium AU392]|nr:endonuclease/exonuclease/phosphatase family protein [Flavobacteriaceae bacterium]RKM85147.1 endonuclease/exonuclease/phosphatase family protein [Flavobacteriaceae bacterium AU392]